MISRRIALGLVPAIGLLAKAQLAAAKNAHHANGHKLLGDKINQNGLHVIGKAGMQDAVAEVKNKKVINMSAGTLPVHKVRSNRRMAARNDAAAIRQVADGQQLAQAEVWYAYCFDDGMDQYCYWYPATDVIVTDGWVDYVPA